MRHIPVMTRTLSRSILLLALGLPMAGCITTAEQVAQRNNERCAERGYQPNTDAFSDCLVRLDSERDARMQARHRELTEKSGAPSLNRGY
jgi:hypothetical protein